MREEIYLEYRDVDGWGLYVGRYLVSDSRPSVYAADEYEDRVFRSATPAAKASRELKLMAIGALEPLISQITQRAKDLAGIK